MFSSETYSIEDCYYWNEQGVTYTSNSNTDRKVLTGLENIVNFTPNGAFEFSFTLEDSSNGSKRLYLISKPQSSTTSNNYGIGANLGSSNNQLVVRTTTTSISGTSGKTNPADFKFIRNGTTLQMYHNDTLLDTKTVNWFDTYAPYTISWAIWNTGTITATNIKIKQL